MSISQKQKSYIETLVINNNYITGGYPLTEFIKDDNNIREQYGGKPKYEGKKKFESLVIPFGGDAHSDKDNTIYNNKQNIQFKNTGQVIEGEIFDKLFDNVAKL